MGLRRNMINKPGFVLLTLSLFQSASCADATEVPRNRFSLAVLPSSATPADQNEAFGLSGAVGAPFAFVQHQAIKLVLYLPCGGDHQQVSLDCGIKKEGTTFYVAPILSTFDPNDACADPLFLSCDLGVLSAGTYTFVNEQASLTIQVPSSVPKIKTRLQATTPALR